MTVQREMIKIPPRAHDLTGKKFGRLTAVGPVGRKNSHIEWLCVCECGMETVVQSGSLNRGYTKSCGCLNIEAVKKANTTHGLRGSAEYNIWTRMKDRCLNKNSAVFPDYGGRGIAVCDSWLDFDKFYTDMGVRPEGMSLDRIDNDGDYSPENCRWATNREQQNNKRNNRLLTHNGKTLTLAQWSRRTGINRDTICGRIKRGWSIEKAVSTPVCGQQTGGSQ